VVPAGIRWRLSVMMFLQYAILGSWSPIFAIHLDELGIDDHGIAWILSTIAIASIAAPFIAGQIADRYFATQRYMALAHIIGAGLLFYAVRLDALWPLFGVMLIYCFLFVPTGALTNSLAFAHLPDPKKTFAPIRLWGTIGWVVVGWVFGMWLGRFDELVGHVSPDLAARLAPMRDLLGQRQMRDCLYLAGGLSLVLGLFSLMLPHTPPTKKAERPWAFVEAVRLMRHRDFAVLAVVVFFLATELAFYYQLSPIFFQQEVGLDKAWVPPVMTIGQIAEVVVLLLLPLSLARLGMRSTIAIGILAWPVRYGIFAIGRPRWLVLASQSLHGVCYAFFVVASQIYVDSVAEKDIRASAQNFLAFLYMGIGKFVGNHFAGGIATHFRRNFRIVFLVPVVITTVFLGVFLVGFRGKEAETVESESDEEAAGS
jgi:nucleoside transporter